MSERCTWGWVVSMLMVALGIGGEASAQACADDSECDKGFTCEVTSAGECAGIACAEGEECEQPTCDLEEVRQCRPGPCATNADCGEGLVCHAETRTSCSSGGASACSPGEDCEKPAEPPTECEELTVKVCLPRYVLPCSDDLDCGSGFTCQPDADRCTCSGGAGSAGDSGGGSDGAASDAFAPPPAFDAGAPQAQDAGAQPPEDACTCEPSTTNHCELEEVVCVTASDCPTAFTCADVPTNDRGDTACAAPEGGDAGACGAAAPPSGEPQAPGKRCAPPYADYFQQRSSDSDGNDEATGSLGGGTNPDASTQGPSGESDGKQASKTDSSCSVLSVRGGLEDRAGLWLLSTLMLGSLVWRGRRRRMR